jgi:hypothetical protein
MALVIRFVLFHRDSTTEFLLLHKGEWLTLQVLVVADSRFAPCQMEMHLVNTLTMVILSSGLGRQVIL